MADQQAGWYPDPSGDASKLRYWDGNQWTNDFTDAQAATPGQPAQPETASAVPEQPVQPAAQPAAQPVQTATPVQPATSVPPAQSYVQGTNYVNPTGQQTYSPAPQPQSNGLAIASLICGIAGLCFGLVAIVAIITGVMGRKNPYNRGMATAGLILGIVGVALWILGIIFIVATGSLYSYY